MSTTATTAAQKATPVAKEISFLDRWLPVWILAAMAVGLLLGAVAVVLARRLVRSRRGSRAP